MQQLSLFADAEIASARPPYENAILQIARKIESLLWGNNKLTPQTARAFATAAFGGSDTNGCWKWKDVYEAQEVATVLMLLDRHLKLSKATGTLKDHLNILESLQTLGLTHTHRTEESLKLQQFSTPLALAFLSISALQIQPGEILLEPSAGTGLLAAFAEYFGAATILNELSESRAAILGKIFPKRKIYRFDAEQIHDFLPTEILPTAIAINPPFSQSPNIKGRNPLATSKHVRSSFLRLAPGGRMALITGHWFSPGCRDWEMTFKDLPHQVLATAYIDGGAYAKQGTTMDTRLTIVDKTEGSHSNHHSYPYDKKRKRFDPNLVQGFLGSIAPRQTALITCPVPIFEETSKIRNTIESPKPLIESPTHNESQFPTRTNRKKPPTPQPTPITIPTMRGELLTYRERFDKGNVTEGALYTTYTPQRIAVDRAKPHPTTLCESISLASVKPPLPKYRPLLPKALIESGILSEPQLESIVYAGESHSKWLGYYIRTESEELKHSDDKDPSARRYRQGWFLGDGTGCGKGRQIAGIILDNWLQGNTKALWISKSDKLIEDARRDWEALGGDKCDIVSLGKFAIGEAIALTRGILFTTYATLRGGKPNKKTRVQQIIDWLDPDTFEGAIAFDEAHAMGNASPEQSENWGAKKSSQQGTAGVQLQNSVPKAKVIYASATGATKAHNLGYATRLGLWNSKLFPFSSASDFIAAIAGGGIAAIEVFCRDLKALGLYLARNLSFEGVERETLESPLTKEQIQIYDSYAKAFAIIHHNLDEALKATNIMGATGKAYNRNAKAAAKSLFEGSKQKFFNHLICSMKTPAAIRAIEADLQAGNAAVIQLISTNEELLNRRLAEIPTSEWNDLNVDLTPRDKILDYLRHAFPVQLYQTYSDEAGNVSSKPMVDEKGDPILSREAVEKRDRLIEDLALLPPMPAALDLILHHFGADRVAEITGRSKRVLRDLETGCLKVSQRSGSDNLKEASSFMNGEKNILVFSNAGGTGRSYHADRNCTNQRRRIHYLLEPGWIAADAIQGLGRTHRTNQASAPLYRLVTSDVRGEKRFTSTIASRLDALGAFTKGQRQTGGQGLYSETDNLQSIYAKTALTQFLELIARNQFANTCTLAEFEAATGLKLMTKDGAIKEKLPSLAKFLNRLLALPISLQNDLFGLFEELLTSNIEGAIAAGVYECGIEQIHAASLIESERETLLEHSSGNATLAHKIIRKEENKFVSVDEARAIAERLDGTFVWNSQSERVAIAHSAPRQVDRHGNLIERIALIRPGKKEVVDREKFNNSYWHKIDAKSWLMLWEEEIQSAPKFSKTEFYLLSGMLFPIWHRLPSGNIKIYRLKTDAGETLLGRKIEIADLAIIAESLGKKKIELNPAQIYSSVMQGKKIELVPGWSLKRTTVYREPSLEICTDFLRDYCERLKLLGCYTHLYAGKLRIFIPIEEEKAVGIIAKVREVLQ